MKPVQLALTVVTSALLMGAMAASSTIPWPWHASDASQLRLSWSARPERIESCRELSDEEFASRPEHMRQRVMCEGKSATYDLRVTVDGALLDSSRVHGSGIRNDRPIFLLRSYAIAEGSRHVIVSFTRHEQVETESPSPTLPDTPHVSRVETRSEREADERRIRAQVAIAPRVVLDTNIVVRRGTVVLVTYESGTLQTRTP